MNKISMAVNKFWGYYELFETPLTAAVVEKVLYYQGFNVVEVGEDSPQDILQLIKKLGLTDLCSSRSGFTYCGENAKFVFLQAYLSPTDKLNVLLHEEGHILLEHFTFHGVLKPDAQRENEANAFVFAVLRKVKQKQLLLKLRMALSDLLTIVKLITFIAIICAVYNLSTDITRNTADSSNYTQPYVDSSTNAIIEQLPSPDSALTEDDMQLICFWTDKGTVYHIYSDCGHLKNSLNIFEGTVAESRKPRCCNDCLLRKLRNNE